MSYIDTFDHELVGFFGGIPVYHPLEEVVRASVTEFATSSSHLILGGGDGEHPAIIFTDLKMVVLKFLQILDGHLSAFDSISSSSRHLLDNFVEDEQCLYFPGWGLEHYHNFYKRCTSMAFVIPYNRMPDLTLFAWMLGSFGEFIYFAAPQLVKEFLPSIQDICDRVPSPLFYNVLIPPPGYPILGGRRRDNLGNIKWGVSFWS
jgi:hypothetical protein